MRARLLTLTCLALGWGCGGQGSPLAKTEAQGAGGAGGVGGMGGAATSTTSSGTGGTGGIEEPAGSRALTLVHGVVDAEAIRVCFVPTEGGAPQSAWPGPDGLPYARGADATDILPDGDAELLVLAGDLAKTGGASCGELASTPPEGVTARSLGVLPEAALSLERSILLVPMGCVGGPGHTDDLEVQICGAGYDPQTGNATVAAGFVSRLTDPGAISLQFVQASLATPVYDLRVRTGPEAPAQLVVPAWSVGAIAPYPPYAQLSEQQLPEPAAATVGVYDGTATNPVLEQSWGEAFVNSTLAPGQLGDGQGAAFIAVGASPGIAEGAWWNAFSYTVIQPLP